MKRDPLIAAACAVAFGVLLSGCSPRGTAKGADSPEGSPPQVEAEQDGILVRVEHPDQFPVVAASPYSSAPVLNVTGVVTADISRNIPVVSMSSGRIIEILARLGDTVRKGQLLMRVQSADIADAFSAYRQAVADERLAVAQLARSKILYEKGAVALKELEISQEAEEKADVVVDTAIERLRVLGADKNHPTATVDVLAPADGVITDQQVTASSGTQGLASPNAFTISDLSHVWVLCDVHEDQLASVAVGEPADIRLNAYPNQLLHGTIGNIGAVLDPNIRTAKVRIEVENPGIMRLGMFAQAGFRPQRSEVHSVVPASAVLHLHDRDWVYVPQDAHTFRRVEVLGGPMLPSERQEILRGIRPGDRVVANVLFLDSTFVQ